MFFSLSLLLSTVLASKRDHHLIRPRLLDVAVDAGVAFDTDFHAPYHLHHSFSGHDFLDSWNWEAIKDPTHGRVNYLSKEDAIAGNLSYATDDKFFMRVESTKVLDPDGPGRDSVRITSPSAYGECLFVGDFAHMPAGCATWPAWWTLSKKGPWPQGGEIDIIEGVNLDHENRASLHTGSNCTVSEPRWQTGTAESSDCYAYANSNTGCGTIFSSHNSFGAPFNRAGGGFFAMQKSRTHGVRVWFWSRDDFSVPHSIRVGANHVSISDLNLPDADFPLCPDSCNYDSHFDDHIMIFDTTLCGDWAGSVFANYPCGGGTCKDFVDNNPEAFQEAYWEVNSVRVYCK